MKFKLNRKVRYVIPFFVLILTAAAVLFSGSIRESLQAGAPDREGLEETTAGSGDDKTEAWQGFKAIPAVDYDSTSPLEFLNILKQHPDGLYTVVSVPDGWINYGHMMELAKYVDSQEPCARVVSALSSYLPQKPSTVGREAIFLIEGFLLGKYPPALHSEGFTGRDVQWYKTSLEEYWRNQLNDGTTFVYLKSGEASGILSNEVRKYDGTPFKVRMVYDRENLERVVSLLEKKTCIWIDKDAANSVDQDWLYKKAVEEKYPVIMVGNSSALYSFRDLLSVCRYMHGPKVPEEERQRNGFAAYLLLNMERKESSLTVDSIFRGFPGNPEIREIISISNRLLTDQKGLREKEAMTPEEKLLYAFWAMKSVPDNQEYIDRVIAALRGIDWSRVYNPNYDDDIFLIMDWFTQRSLAGDQKALEAFLQNRKGLDGAYTEGYLGQLLKILESNAGVFVKSLAILSNDDIDKFLNLFQYELNGSKTVEKRLKEALKIENFSAREKTVLEKLLLVTTATGMISAKSVTVETVQEFFEAIGPDTIIYLKPGSYKLDELSGDGGTNAYAALVTERDGNSLEGGQLVIHDVNNLRIVGTGEKPVEILTKYQLANVITFENAHNIGLTNIRAGHWPDPGGCYGGVAVFKKSSNITIDRCSFFGCGINGMELLEVMDVEMTDSVIEDCNFHILCINNSNNILFQRSDFINNRGGELINISGCKNVRFEACNIAGNSGVTDIGVLFAIDGGYSAYVTPFERNDTISDILIKNSAIKDNSTVSAAIGRFPAESAGSLVFEDTVFEGNSFAAPP